MLQNEMLHVLGIFSIKAHFTNFLLMCEAVLYKTEILPLYPGLQSSSSLLILSQNLFISTLPDYSTYTFFFKHENQYQYIINL